MSKFCKLIKYNNPEDLQQFIDDQPDSATKKKLVNTRFKTGHQYFPIEIAVHYNAYEAFEVLIKNGADICYRKKNNDKNYYQNYEYENLLMLAIEAYIIKGKKKYINTLLASPVQPGATEIFECFMRKNIDDIELFKKLLEKANNDLGMSLEKPDEESDYWKDRLATVIFPHYIKKNNVEYFEVILDYLMNNKADLIEDIFSCCLIEACDKNKYVLMEYLIDNGANINYESKDEYTQGPLVTCLSKYNEKGVELLIKKGVNVNQISYRGGDKYDEIEAEKITPLMYIIWRGFNESYGYVYNFGQKDYKKILDFTKLLLKHGADPNYKSNYGKSPIKYAIGSCQLDVLNLLLANGGRLEEEDILYLTYYI